MSDEMFFSKDERSLVRGKRIAARTETCRPCFVYTGGEELRRVQGVIVDMNPWGMLIRMMEPLSEDSPVVVQMMRDDKYEKPFSDPREGTVVRADSVDGMFVDHGVRLMNKAIPKASERPVEIKRPRPMKPVEPTRMHTIDITVGGSSRARRGG